MKCAQIAATSFFDPLTRRCNALDCCLRGARSASRSKPSPKAVPGRGRSAEAVDESETGSANFFGPARDAGPFLLDPFSCCTNCSYTGQAENRANCAHALLDPLDHFGVSVSVLLAPSTERE